MKGSWTQEKIGGKPADLYVPGGGAKPRFGLLYLHPYGLETLVDRPSFTQHLDEFGMACICPQGAHSWWADRVCAEFDPQITAEKYLLNQVIPLFGQRWDLRPRVDRPFRH